MTGSALPIAERERAGGDEQAERHLASACGVEFCRLRTGATPGGVECRQEGGCSSDLCSMRICADTTCLCLGLSCRFDDQTLHVLSYGYLSLYAINTIPVWYNAASSQRALPSLRLYSRPPPLLRIRPAMPAAGLDPNNGSRSETPAPPRIAHPSGYR